MTKMQLVLGAFLSGSLGLAWAQGGVEVSVTPSQTVLPPEWPELWEAAQDQVPVHCARTRRCKCSDVKGCVQRPG